MSADEAPPLIGIIGGYGEVGAAAARCLAEAGGFRLRIGGRDGDAAELFARALTFARPEDDDCHGRTVDAADASAVARFSEGCRAVLNCAGPSWLLPGATLRAVWEQGADYADVAGTGDVPHLTGTAGDLAEQRAAVLGAGLSPGLSGMLPRLLTAGTDDANDAATGGKSSGEKTGEGARFSGCYAGLGPFTRTGATDYLLSSRSGYGTPLGEWRDGRVVRGSVRRREECRIPGLPRPLTAVPYLPDELAQQASRLGLARARWYNAFDGERLLESLERHRDVPAEGAELDAAVSDVLRGAAVDAAGHSPYHVLWGRLEEPEAEGARVRRSVLVHGTDGSALTGVVGAAAVDALVRGRIPAGVHEAATVLPTTVLEWVRGHLPATVVTRTHEAVPADADGDASWDLVDEELALEEGEL